MIEEAFALARNDINIDRSGAGTQAEADNVIDLRPYLRREQEEDDAPINITPRPDADERLTTTPNDVDLMVRSMFMDAVDLPIPEQLAELTDQLGLEADADENQADVGDHV